MELVLICIAAGVLLAAAYAGAEITYKDGFKWTWFDYGNWAKGDLADSVYGRTAPGVWAGNPSPDKGSLADPANEGKFEGTGFTNLWHYFYEPALGPGLTASEPKTLTDLNMINGVAGYFHGQMGLYKSANLDGIGAGSQPAIYCGDTSNWFWVGFKAPRNGLYTYNWNTTGADRVDYGTQILNEGTSWPVLSSGSVNMQAGEFLYFHGFAPGSVAWGGYLNITVSSGQGTITGHVTDSYGAPIRGAGVRTVPGDLIAFTDDFGEYNLIVPIGPCDVTASGDCYDPQTVQGLFVEKDQTITQDFTLTAKECPENLALAAYATSMGAASPSMDSYGNDGSRGTAFLAANVSGGWFQLDWPESVTFTKMKVYLTGDAPLPDGAPNVLAVQCWDETAQLWYTLCEAANSDGVRSGAGHRLFELEVPGGYPVTTARLRLGYYSHPNQVSLEELEVYNTPIATASISGRVTDSTGVGKAYARVSTSTGGFSATTGPDGTYHMSVEPGTYDLVASRYCYDDATVTGVVVGADQAVVGKDFVLARQPSGDIAPFANPHADYTVSLYPEIQAIDGKTRTAWYGTWDALSDYCYYLDWGSDVTIKQIQFTGANMAGWSVQVWNEAGGNWSELAIGEGSSGSYTIPADAGVVTSKFRIQYLANTAPGIYDLRIMGVQGEGAAVKGTVRDSEGSPIAGAVVSTPAGQSTTTAADGTYTLIVVPGVVDVTATKFAYSSQTLQVTVPAGGVVTGVDFTLSRVLSNLAASATFNASFTDAATSTFSGNDGSRSTSWMMGVYGNWNGAGWFELEWPSAISFSRSRLYLPSNNIWGDSTSYGLIFQKWDATRGVWSDWYYAHRTDAQQTPDGDYLVDIASPGPITTSKIRCVAAHYGLPPIVVSEWEVYDAPFVGSSISGRVTNSASGAPLHHVLLSAGSASAYTDSDGNYSMVVDPGTYTLQASRAFFDSASIDEVVVSAGQSVTGKDLALTPAPNDQMQVHANAYASSFLIVYYDFWKANDANAGTSWMGVYPSLSDSMILDWGVPVTFDRVHVPTCPSASALHLAKWDASAGDWVQLYDTANVTADYISPRPITTSKLKLTHDTRTTAVYPGAVPEIEVLTLPEDSAVSTSKTKPDGTSVRAEGWLVSAVFADGFYMQSPDRSTGIRVTGSALPAVGDVVAVAGKLTTDAGERVIAATGVDLLDHGQQIDPLGVTNKAIGGRSDGHNLGVTGGVGTNSLGLLVRTTGRVVAVDEANAKLWIDDGSAVPAQSAGGIRYGNGFRWTFYDSQEASRGDWCDAINGRTSPGAPTGNPSGDSASISDPANTGKVEGQGSTKLWYYLHEPTGAAGDPKSLLEQVNNTAYGIPIAGYWLSATVGTGFYKESLADGVGVAEPTMAGPNVEDLWVGFRAPRTGTYSFEYNTSGSQRIDHGTQNVASGPASVVLRGSEQMNAGEYLYFRTSGDWARTWLLTITLQSGGDTMGDGSTGVCVKDVAGTYSIGDYVCVTGVASVTSVGGTRYRVIRPRNAADIQRYW